MLLIYRCVSRIAPVLPQLLI